MTERSDVNAVVSGLLRDLAFVQESRQKSFGYTRAAAAIFALDRPLDQVVRPDGSLPKIPGIGPASTRVILEVLSTGGSSTVDQAAADSGQAAEVAERRSLRARALSRAAVVAVLEDRSLQGPSVSEYRGDFQMHSVWSDGGATVAELAEACVGRGYLYCAITDHSHGLKIAGGMSMTDAAAQHAEIDALNHTYRDRFHVIKGVEANIDADGRLDLAAEEIGAFELVLAAPHAKLRSREDQTSRMIAAVRTPGVGILAHPRGRIAGSRAGIVADWRVVFAEAAERRVAIELDGDPFRQDLDYELAAAAREAGCLFALDSDAHAPDQLAFIETAVAHARLAGIEPDRIVNSWSLERLLAWLSEGGR